MLQIKFLIFSFLIFTINLESTEENKENSNESLISKCNYCNLSKNPKSIANYWLTDERLIDQFDETFFTITFLEAFNDIDFAWYEEDKFYPYKDENFYPITGFKVMKYSDNPKNFSNYLYFNEDIDWFDSSCYDISQKESLIHFFLKSSFAQYSPFYAEKTILFF